VNHWLGALSQDLRYGVRLLSKNPGLSLVLVVTLGLGIGANTAIFSIIDAVLLRPLPFFQPEQLVTIENPGYLVSLSSDEPSRFLQIEERPLSLDSVGIYNSGWASLSDASGNMAPEHALIMETSAGFFPTLGSPPAKGRTFSRDDGVPGQNGVAILSWSFWQNRYRGESTTVGRTIAINGRNFIVIGVMPRSFRLPTYDGDVDVWVPLTLPDDLLQAEGIQYRALGRLKTGVSITGAQAEMDAIMWRSYPAFRGLKDANRITLVPLRKMFEGDARPALLLLLGAAGFVLLIACANVANLLLAQAVGRQRETAIRRTFGADRLRLIRQWLTESILLGLAGGALGVVLAFWSLKGLIVLGSFYLRNVFNAAVDLRVLAFALTASVGTGVFFGLAPAIQFSSRDLIAGLKTGTTASSMRAGRLRQTIVVLELALAMILLCGAGLLLRTLGNLWRVDPGFDKDQVLAVSLSAPKEKYSDQKGGMQSGAPVAPAQTLPATSTTLSTLKTSAVSSSSATPSAPKSVMASDRVREIAFYQQVIDRIKVIPGIQAVGSVNHLPLDSKNGSTFFAMLRFENRNSGPGPGGTFVGADRVASPDYFRAMGVPLLRGRKFTEQDNLQAPPVVIINQYLAHQAFGDENPIGKYLSFGLSKTARTCEIVGVVGNIKHWGLDKSVDPEVFESSLQIAPPFMTIAIRTRLDMGSAATEIRRAVSEVDKSQPIYNVRSMDQVIGESLSQRHFVMVLLEIFSLFALLLSAVGTYGLMSYCVGQRTQEIGVRIALGASPGNILRLVARQGLAPVLGGVVLGVLGSFGLMRFLSGLLFGVKPLDPITLVTVSITLIVMAMAACCHPWYRAIKVDPNIALRYE
jgi:putative ABC transport system permease protein